MSNNPIEDFIKDLRTLFEDTDKKPKEGPFDYLDLGEISDCSPEQLLNAQWFLPVDSPAYNAFLKIVGALQTNEILHARLGINEFLRQYLRHTVSPIIGCSSHTFLEHLYLIVLFFTQDGFPYEQYFYDYLIKCYHPVCSFLLSRQKEEEIALFMEHIAAVGKIAAQKQKDTGSIHHLLRNIETYAGTKQLKDLAAKAKDSRYNLEI